MENRPLLSRRVHGALTRHHSVAIVRMTWSYLGYMFRSGPFKDLLVKFGVDPRSDSKYRIYQSVSFQAPEQRRGNKKRYGQPEADTDSEQLPKTYMFDGIGVYLDSRVWQFCDITDPMLRKWLDTAVLNDEFEPSVVGWYGTGTIAILRQVMREKIIKFLQGEPVDNDLYAECKSHWIDHVTEFNIDLTHPNVLVDPAVSAVLSSCRGRAIAMAKEVISDRRRRGLLDLPSTMATASDQGRLTNDQLRALIDSVEDFDIDLGDEIIEDEDDLEDDDEMDLEHEDEIIESIEVE
jgi:RNA polymerase III transcription factor (TF)IIIC subunit HTH domain